MKLSQFLQYLSKYALLSSSCFTTLNKEVWTWKDDWPPRRTSTYEKPFTQEVNYLVGLMWSEKTSVMSTSKSLGVQIWQIYLLWPMDPPIVRLVLGRWTYFGQWTPPDTAEMPWMPVHNTWQTNTLWQMDPPIQLRCLECQYTTLGRQTHFGRWTPW